MRNRIAALVVISAVLALPSFGQEAKEEPSRKPAPKAVPKSAPDPKKEGERKETPSEKLKRPWVGVATSPVDSSLRRHLELDEGFGIQIAEVIADSPASKAGLKNHDILTRFEDQLLISPEHLALLVKTKSSGDTVSLSIIRKGSEEVVKVTLGETDDDFATRWSPGHPEMSANLFPPHGDRNNSQWQENMKRQQDFMHEWMERNRPEMPGHDPRHDSPASRREGDSPKPQEEGHRPPGGLPPAISVNPGFPLRVFGSEGVVKIDNEAGELTLTRKDGKHHLEIKDADGKVVYNGPFDPVAGTKSLPKAALEQLERMKLGNFEILLPESPIKLPEKTRDSETEKDKDDGIL